MCIRDRVTGYKGFIGRNLSNYLLTQGHDVEGWEYIDNAVPDPSSYDWVIHLGAITSTTYTDVDRIIDQNFEYSMRLLQVCDNYGVNFQYASSASVYGPTTHFKEDGPLLPQSPYAWSKYLFDRFKFSRELSEETKKLSYIAVGKEGFFKHHLGLGDSPTVDAIEKAVLIAGTPNLNWDYSPLITQLDPANKLDEGDPMEFRAKGPRKAVGYKPGDPMYYYPDKKKGDPDSSWRRDFVNKAFAKMDIDQLMNCLLYTSPSPRDS